MPMLEMAALSSLFLFLISLLAVFAGGRGRMSGRIYAVSILPCLAAALAGGGVLVGAPVEGHVLPLGLPWVGMHVRLDALSAVFLILIGIGGGATSLYAIGYGRHEAEPGRVLPFYPAFLGAMIGVVLADDAFTFLLSWEVMSLLSWALVLAHHHSREVRLAGYLYILMAAFGTMTLLLAFGLLAGNEGSYAFSDIREAPHSLAISVSVLGLALLGTGSKAGLVPLHVWLPQAHPAAPSHVSALMSGVMTKVAIYGFVRIAFDLIGALPWWVSPALIFVGASTAVVGILNAVVAEDIKKILAYSTIENIGVVFAALGLAMAFRTNGMETAAALALSASLFHALNHMAFKSLLFMSAGAVLTATGRRNLDGLGGLIHRMPVTSALTLVGVVAISALPPLNGFASEWLIFQTVLTSPELPQLGLQIIVPAAGGMLALAAALAAAAFVRLYGVGFLGRGRSEEAGSAREVDRFMLGAMALLAGICVMAGLVPGYVLDRLAPAVMMLTESRLPVQGTDPWLTLTPIAEARSTYNPLLVFFFIAISGVAAAVVVHRVGSRALRRAPAWDCGFPDPSPTTQYGAGSFAQPLRRVLGPVLLQASEDVTMPPPGDLRPARHNVNQRDLAWEWLYLPIAHAVGRIARVSDRLQFLTIRRYLSLVMGSLVALLLALALWH